MELKRQTSFSSQELPISFTFMGLKYLIQYILLFVFFYIIETVMLIYHAAGPMSPWANASIINNWK